MERRGGNSLGRGERRAELEIGGVGRGGSGGRGRGLNEKLEGSDTRMGDKCFIWSVGLRVEGEGFSIGAE